MEQLGPPPGGDIDKSTLIFGVTWGFTSMSLIFVILRVYSRIKHVNNLWWDDLFIVLGEVSEVSSVRSIHPHLHYREVLTVAVSIVITIYVLSGGSRHLYYLSNLQALKTLKLNYIFQAFIIMAFACCKVSIAFLILRFKAPGQFRTGALVFLASSYWLWSVLDLIFLFAQCRPSKALWNPSVKAKCWRNTFTNFTLALSSYNAFLDLAYASIAVSIIWQLQLRLHRRINLSLLLSVGIV